MHRDQQGYPGPGPAQLAGRRDECGREGPGYCFQQVRRDCGGGGSPIVLGICRATLHGGSCRRVLAPWVILADGPGGLAVPGLAGRVLAAWYAAILRHVVESSSTCAERCLAVHGHCRRSAHAHP